MRQSQTVPRMKELWRSHWGVIIQIASLLASFIGLAHSSHWAHYEIFTGAGRNLWRGITPYGTDFGTKLGLWFYSPTVGMFFYGPLNLLPRVVGIYVYMLASVSVFIWGVLRFSKVLYGRDSLSFLPTPFFNWFWVFISFELMGGILATKLEVVMSGIILLIGSYLMERRHFVLSGIFMAMMINWKFQPLPEAGLMALVLVFVERDWKFIASLVVSLFVWFALPLLFLPWSKLMAFQHQWHATLQPFIASQWFLFCHLFKFPRNVLRIPISLIDAQIISAVVGTFLAGLVLCWIFKVRSILPRPEILRRSMALALALGSFFIVGFSPLSETNAFIMYAPLLLVAVYLGDELKKFDPRLARLWFYGLLLNCFLTSVTNSDIITSTGRIFCNNIGVKPYGSLVLAVMISVFYFRKSEMFMEPRRSLQHPL